MISERLTVGTTAITRAEGKNDRNDKSGDPCLVAKPVLATYVKRKQKIPIADYLSGLSTILIVSSSESESVKTAALVGPVTCKFVFE